MGRHALKQAAEFRAITKNKKLFGVDKWEGENIYIIFVVLELNFGLFKKQERKSLKSEDI